MATSSVLTIKEAAEDLQVPVARIGARAGAGRPGGSRGRRGGWETGGDDGYRGDRDC
jgi:hypothetical protein